MGTRKDGKKCLPQDWATIHWKTYGKDGQKLEDSREYGTKQPTVFQIGMYTAVKCFDITASQMHAGQTLKIRCPSYLAYGGSSRYGHFDELIPGNSELIFELEVLECQPSVAKINAANKRSGNNAPLVVLHGGSRLQAENPAKDKGDIADVKGKVKNLRKAVIGQNKRITQDKLKNQDVEKGIVGGDNADQYDSAEKMMRKDEKILKEEKIVDKERKAIKKVKKAVKKAENPSESGKDDGKGKESEHPDGFQFTKAMNEVKVDKAGKPLTPNPPPFDCFFIMYPEKDERGQNLVLEIDHKDKYFPKKTGIYNVRFHPFEGDMKEEDEDNHVKAQQWKFDPVNHKLITKAYPDKVLFQGNNRNLVVYNNMHMKN